MLALLASLAPAIEVQATGHDVDASGDRQSVHHRLSFPRRTTQYVHVEIRIPVSGAALELAMPNWTPGSYQIRDYAGNVERVAARAVTGSELPLTKIAKNRWLVETGGAEEVRFEYDVWAGSLSVQDSWVEQDVALLNGAGIFMYSDSSRDMTQFLEVELPADWPGVVVALPGPDESGRYRARNFDELVDSPILAGDSRKTPFEAGGARFALVDYGHTAQWDSVAAAEDLWKIAETQVDFWGVNPLEREYLFINILLGGKSGLEHDHSTVMMGSPSLMRSREDYVKWLSLASHELFHAWNVRRMRPEALARYDYDEEVYTSQLWLAEGLTSYYDNLLLSRAKVVSAQEFLELLAAEFQQYEIQPGRLVTSAELASFDSWIRHYQPTANLINSNSNYYRKGSVIGFVIDTAIRRETRGRHTLDDALRDMYQRYGPEGPGAGTYPEGALAAIVEDLAGPGVAAELETLRTTATDPDIDGALGWYGLKLVRSPERQAAEEGGIPAPVDFGVTWLPDTPLLLVEHVLHGSPAAEAGVLPNDELLAINGLRVTRDNHDAAIKALRLGETAQLTLVRHGRLLTLQAQVQHALPSRYVITASERVSSSEERRLEALLGRELRISR